MRKSISYIFIFVFMFSACDFESEGVFTDDTTEEYQLYDYYIDSYGNEGVVAYIHNSSTSDSKYIIAISANEVTLPWGPMGEAVFKSDTITGLGLRSHSFGIAMLQLMKSIGIQKFPAQAWCDAKNNDEEFPRAGSWHLPSYYEYQLIFGSKGRNVNNLNIALTNIGATPFTDNLYWTCTEDHNNYVTSSNQEFDYDKENRAVITSPYNATYFYKNHWLKKNAYLVRSIKYVYYHD